MTSSLCHPPTTVTIVFHRNDNIFPLDDAATILPGTQVLTKVVGSLVDVIKQSVVDINTIKRRRVSLAGNNSIPFHLHWSSSCDSSSSNSLLVVV